MTDTILECSLQVQESSMSIIQYLVFTSMNHLLLSREFTRKKGGKKKSDGSDDSEDSDSDDENYLNPDLDDDSDMSDAEDADGFKMEGAEEFDEEGFGASDSDGSDGKFVYSNSCQVIRCRHFV